MPSPWSQRLLTVLQLTRMALVFTAIADGWCGLALRRSWDAPGATFGQLLDPWSFALMAAVSIGLYGFGMSLNDIIDRRRDRQISPGRPLPSGRVSVATAHVICFGLLAVAVGAGAALHAVDGAAGLELLLVIVTLVLIWFYDAAGKYLVGPGLVTLGLVRLAQSMIPALRDHPLPQPLLSHPLIWHPLWLFNHVAILSAVCYAWEEKRPALTKRHWFGVAAALLAVNAAAIWMAAGADGQPIESALRIDWRLAIPVTASAAFAAVAWNVRRRSPSRRAAGQTTMLYGLLWLIVYDACFAAAYAHWAAGVGILLLLPVAHLSVQFMRGWSKLLAASQRPEFKRAGM